MQIDAENKLYFNKFSNDTEVFEQIIECIYPHKSTIPLIKIGNDYDGGYWLLNDFAKVNACISLGVGPEDSFGIHLANYGIKVKSYDHTVDFTPSFSDNFYSELSDRLKVINPIDFYKFIKKGITTKTKQVEDCITIEEILEDFPDENEIILKMDIDGLEYLVLKDFDFYILNRFSQITIEFDNFPFGKQNLDIEFVKSVFEKLTYNHKVVYINGNNIGDWNIIGGFPVPRCLELTFARNDKARNLEKSFQAYVEMPNNLNSSLFPRMRKSMFDLSD